MELPDQQAQGLRSRLARLVAALGRGKAASAAVVVSVLSLGVAGASLGVSHRATAVAVRAEQVALHLTWRTESRRDGEVLALSQPNPALVVQGVTLTLPKVLRDEPIRLHLDEMSLRSTWFEDGVAKAFADCAKKDHVVLVSEPIPVLVDTHYAVGGQFRRVEELYVLHYTASFEPQGLTALSLTGLAPAKFEGADAEKAMAVANWTPRACQPTPPTSRP